MDGKAITRFAEKIDLVENGCWRWTADDNTNNGYGRFSHNGKPWVAHRWVWEAINGPVPEGLVLDHFRHPQDGCIGPLCVNPHHVKPVTQRENVLRGNSPSAHNARKTVCSKGHPYDRRDSRGQRRCSTCQAAYSRARYAAKVAARRSADHVGQLLAPLLPSPASRPLTLVETS
ncbi:HNH endonuclease [Planomonospora venezuelensis]|uniref:HNH nuclease domain-containing protein n=1 Tax=Planomonospora venezuelensis TaxID=1999 RepID=A0A841CY33_PLAVE|nr:HNH endonuclease [Planomonospora venezuelensis]MBB5960855.1 hypothetical protein [Planomonospora venezuelensis]